MNRLWIRLSLSYVLLLLVVPVGSILSFWFLTNGSKAGIETGENTLSILSDIGLIALSSLIFGVLTGVLVGRNLGKQVTQLVAATQTITLDNLEYRVEVQGIQEFQELAASFNRMIDELDRSQQQRRNLLADVSHELLTPLTVLKGNLRAILDDVYSLDKEEISQLYDQTHHMISLVKDLRQLAQAEAQQLTLILRPTAINALVIETVSLFEPFSIEKNITLRQTLSPHVPHLTLDPQRIRQVLSNLLSNALRHTPDGSVIIVKTAVIDQMVQISVQDSGNGLDDAEAARIFERFYRGDNSVRRDAGGAGLGLAIVKALVEAHGGVVSAKSENGQGTTFIVSLPVTTLTMLH